MELDLLRGGPRLPMDNPPPCDYCVLVARREEFPEIGIWPISLRDPLPAVPVPLRAPHADAKLELQPLLHRLYDAAGYGDYIYRGTPRPPLRPEEAEWARRIVPSAE